MLVSRFPLPDADYMRRQAERCFRLARQMMNSDIRDLLEQMGREFEEKARLLDMEAQRAKE
jgi:hypothetical protein